MIRNGYIRIENICVPIGILAVGFEHSQHKNIWLNDIWNIPGLMKWIQTKWLFQNICSQFDLTQTKVPYQKYLHDCACFTWSGSKLVLFPLALIQCWWFKMHKFQSRIVFIWLTKLHLSSEMTAICSEMVICSIFGSKMYTSFERS